MSGTPSARGRSDAQRDLLSSIRHKRNEAVAYLRTVDARRRLLLNVTIIAGACAASLTAAPALGGKSLADWITSTFDLRSPSWQILCALAAACSLLATVSTQLLRSHNIDEHVMGARNALARLEVLEIAIISKQMDNAQAVSEYMRCIEGMPFIQAGKRERQAA
jgi:hypothetical protein